MQLAWIYRCVKVKDGLWFKRLMGDLLGCLWKCGNTSGCGVEVQFVGVCVFSLLCSASHTVFVEVDKMITMQDDEVKLVQCQLGEHGSERGGGDVNMSPLVTRESALLHSDGWFLRLLHRILQFTGKLQKDTGKEGGIKRHGGTECVAAATHSRAFDPR